MLCHCLVPFECQQGFFASKVDSCGISDLQATRQGRNGKQLRSEAWRLRVQSPIGNFALETQSKGGVMLLIGFEAIEFAQQEGFTLNKEGDGIDGPATGLSIAEASAIAVDRPDLIWLEVSESDYFGKPKNMEPQR
jgi:hypothetical protein